jgi:hypothetical protein
MTRSQRDAAKLAAMAEAEAELDVLAKKIKWQAPSGRSARDLWVSLGARGDQGHVVTQLKELAERGTIHQRDGLWYWGACRSEAVVEGQARRAASEPLAPGDGGHRRIAALTILRTAPDGLSARELYEKMPEPRGSYDGFRKELTELKVKGIVEAKGRTNQTRWCAVRSTEGVPREPSAADLSAESQKGGADSDPCGVASAGVVAHPEVAASGRDALARASAPGPAPTGERQPESAEAPSAPVPPPHRSPSPGPETATPSPPARTAASSGGSPEGGGSRVDLLRACRTAFEDAADLICDFEQQEESLLRCQRRVAELLVQVAERDATIAQIRRALGVQP